MARTQITVSDIIRGGLARPASRESDPVANHYFLNDGYVYLEIVSHDGGVQTVSLEPGTGLSDVLDDLEADPEIISIPAGGTILAGPFRKRTFNQSSNGSVYVDPSSNTLSFYAFRLTPTP